MAEEIDFNNLSKIIEIGNSAFPDLIASSQGEEKEKWKQTMEQFERAKKELNNITSENLNKLSEILEKAKG
jgi:tellurite resistance protein